MKLYAISGLGADKRVFKYLNLDCELIPIDWIKPQKDETIENYALRLFDGIKAEPPFGILGVSFGGLIATEISKKYSPEITILISSAETKNELRAIFRTVGKLKLVENLPSKLFDPPRPIANFLFGAENKTLLHEILKDTDLEFARWSVNQLLSWKNEERLKNCVTIGGTNDKLIPQKDNQTILIEGGEHFMIVDKADEISQIINEKLKE